MTCRDAEDALRERFGEDHQFAVIGPAGENLVKFGCWVNVDDRASGRGGTGNIAGVAAAIVVLGRTDDRRVTVDGNGGAELVAGFAVFQSMTSAGPPDAVAEEIATAEARWQFDCVCHPSLTADDARIVEIQNLRRRHP